MEMQGHLPGRLGKALRTRLSQRVCLISGRKHLRAIARETLSVLRQRLPGAPGRLPAWAVASPPRALLAALMIGGWHEEDDCRILEEIAGQPYEEIIKELAPMVRDLDSPLQKVGPAWRITSPIDAPVSACSGSHL